MHRIYEGGSENFVLAREQCERAVAIESGFARGWGCVAGANLLLGFFDIEPAEEVIPKAREAAQRAIALDGREAVARMSLGYIALFFDWDWDTARRELELALELNPTNVLVHHAYADYLGVMGELDRSVEQCLLGRKYDPFGYWANQFVLGHLVMAGRYEEAVLEAPRMVELFPDHLGIRNFYALALWKLDRYEDALEQYREGWGADSRLVRTLERGLAEGGPEAAMRARADELAALSKTEPIDPLSVARYYGLAGDVDAAFVWLERALERRTPQILHMPMDPRFELLRADPRFNDLLRRIGLPVR
jgi:tetratricopeptide (TPR) repeat protein